MSTIDEMNKAESAEEMLVVVKELVKDKSFLKLSTCISDSYGWKSSSHFFMSAIKSKLEGFKVDCKLSFEVYDWYITKEI
jgi:hypothetical protein